MNQGYSSAPHTLVLEYRSTEGETAGTFISAQADFATPQPYSQNVPYALWGTQMLDTSNPNSVNQDSMISNTIGGFLLLPANPVMPGNSQIFARSLFAYETKSDDNAFVWEDTGSFTLDHEYEAPADNPIANLNIIQAVQTSMLDPDVQQKRQGVLNVLNFLTTSFNLNQDMSQYTAYAPRYGSFEES